MLKIIAIHLSIFPGGIDASRNNMEKINIGIETI